MDAFVYIIHWKYSLGPFYTFSNTLWRTGCKKKPVLTRTNKVIESTFCLPHYMIYITVGTDGPSYPRWDDFGKDAENERLCYEIRAGQKKTTFCRILNATFTYIRYEGAVQIKSAAHFQFPTQFMTHKLTDLSMLLRGRRHATCDSWNKAVVRLHHWSERRSHCLCLLTRVSLRFDNLCRSRGWIIRQL